MKVVYLLALCTSLLFVGCGDDDNPVSSGGDNGGATATQLNFKSIEEDGEVWFLAEGNGSLTAGEVDWYKVDLPKKAEEFGLEIGFVNEEGTIDVELYDSPSASTPIKPSEIYKESDYGSVSAYFDGKIGSGTYYIKVYSSTNDVGNYIIECDY